MPTSSKVKFKLDELQKRANTAAQARVEAQQKVVASFDDDDTLAERLKEWRADQERRISELFRQLGDGGVSDHQLAQFRVHEAPDGGSAYERHAEQRRLRQLEEQRDRIAAKAGSLVADEDGNIALTKTQLSEFFGL